MTRRDNLRFLAPVRRWPWAAVVCDVSQGSVSRAWSCDKSAHGNCAACITRRSDQMGEIAAGYQESLTDPGFEVTAISDVVAVKFNVPRSKWISVSVMEDSSIFKSNQYNALIISGVSVGKTKFIPRLVILRIEDVDKLVTDGISCRIVGNVIQGRPSVRCGDADAETIVIVVVKNHELRRIKKRRLEIDCAILSVSQITVRVNTALLIVTRRHANRPARARVNDAIDGPLFRVCTIMRSQVTSQTQINDK